MFRMKLHNRHICLFIFIFVTIIYLAIKWIIFKGFNGTDDLHYGILAARMLRGAYNPFEPGDIFSGRILLIASQAAVYRVAGINIFSTQLGSLLVAVLSCYLTVFRLLPVRTAAGTLLASCLFYFNPVVTGLTFEIGGDIYILLAGLLVCLLINARIQAGKTLKANVITGSVVAFVVAVSLLYKETILVFLPFTCIAAFLYGREHAKQLILSGVISFSLMLLLYAVFYYTFTGDALFRITQIRNSSYPNHCSYDLLPVKELLVRLTYGVYQEFIVRGFYPVVLALIVAAFEICIKGKMLIRENRNTVFFVVLLISSLYFPFSFSSYQPLCSDARQFLFLLPLGVVVTTQFICSRHSSAEIVLAAGSLAALVICICSTGNKWQWLIYLLISGCFLLAVLVKRLSPAFMYTALPAVIGLSLLEHLFFQNSNWFKDMQVLEKRIASKYYYFPDHDNMMHWQLLHHFNQDSLVYYNLYQRPFKAFRVYYQPLQTGSFHPGWFILNKAYNVRPPTLLTALDSLYKPDASARGITVGDVSAFYIGSPSGLAAVQALMHRYE